MLSSNVKYLSVSKKVFFLWLAIGWSLFSCSQFNKPARLYFEESTCDPPCWNNIIPGTTTVNDVVSSLDTLEIVKHETIEIRSDLNSYDFNLEDNSFVSIETKNGIVSEISIVPSHKLRFGELVEKFGNPSSIFAEEIGGGLVGYVIYLHYPERGIILQLLWYHEVPKYRKIPIGSFALEEEIRIQSIHYFQATQSFEETLLNFWNLAQHAPTSINTTNWNGLGIYSINDFE